MKNVYIILITILITAVTTTVVITEIQKQNTEKYTSDIQNLNGFSTNDKFIDGLYQQELNLSDPKEVFRYVFSRLDNEVTIYPTENYYYFIFPSNGKIIWGSMSLFASNRDDGIIDIGYIEKFDKSKKQIFSPSMIGGGSNFTEKDGVVVKKINDFNYSVTFEGKKVIFKLYDIGLTPPSNLHEDEIFVGPVFDESGLKFNLIFNNTEQHLFWMLNEEGYVPETFEYYVDDIVIGSRTDLAFYVDKYNDKSRKILIGAEGLNVLNNNWYDGPFDQMPDNYVYTGQIEVKKYIEASYPTVAGTIDKYGNYLDEEGARIAIGPYMVYFSKSDLENNVKLCGNESMFYSCITQQIFNVPEDYYAGLMPPIPDINYTNYTGNMTENP